MISSTTRELSAFTELFAETLTEEYSSPGIFTAQENMHPRGMNLPEGTKYVAFRHHDCSDQFWLLLDNVRFSDELLDAMDDVDASGVSVYTEPSQLFVDCPAAGLLIELYSLDGRRLAKRYAVAGSNVFDLAQGFYLLKVGAETHKILID